MRQGDLKAIDDKVYYSMVFGDKKTKFLKIVTFLGDFKFLFLFTTLFFFLYPNKNIAYLFTTNVILSSILNAFIKRIIKRERPNIKRLVFEKGYSYPSGHTTSTFCIYGSLFFIMLVSSISIPLKVVCGIVFTLFFFLIPYSRIYLGVHYFSDIIGAMFLSFTYLSIYYYFLHSILNLV